LHLVGCFYIIFLKYLLAFKQTRKQDPEDSKERIVLVTKTHNGHSMKLWYPHYKDQLCTYI